MRKANSPRHTHDWLPDVAEEIRAELDPREELIAISTVCLGFSSSKAHAETLFLVDDGEQNYLLPRFCIESSTGFALGKRGIDVLSDEQKNSEAQSRLRRETSRDWLVTDDDFAVDADYLLIFVRETFDELTFGIGMHVKANIDGGFEAVEFYLVDAAWVLRESLRNADSETAGA